MSSRLVEELKMENAQLRSELDERDVQIKKPLVLSAIDLVPFRVVQGKDQMRTLLEHISGLVDAMFKTPERSR